MSNPVPEPDAEPPEPPEPPVPPAATSGAGTPLVLLHAFPLDGRMWAPQVEALAGTYQVIVPDLRGFGAARDQAVEEAGMALLADDVARHPDRVSGLILLDTKATADGDQAREDRLRMADRVLAEGNDFVPEAMLPKLLGETTREHRPEVVEKVAALIREQAPEAIAGAQRGMAARPATTDLLASIGVPTLVVTGEEDAVTGPEIGRELAAAIPGARFLLVEEAGHLVNLEQPEIVNEALLDFLAPLWV